MPNRSNPDEEPKEKRQFMREKVVRPPMSRKQVALKVCSYALIAAIGGLAAGAGFAVARPLAEKYLVPEETEESIPVTIPKDEPETTPPETLPPVTESETPETEPIEEMVQSALEEYEYNVEDIRSLYTSLRDVAVSVDDGIVVVHPVKQELDWFDNSVETSDTYAGVVIASTNREFLIMTPVGAVEDADSIKVAFSDNTEAAATVKETDETAGMAVVSVDKFSLTENTRNTVQPLQLGNSYSVKQGDLLVALGAPAGFVRSTTYGAVSYVMKNVQVADGTTRLLFADIAGDPDKGTFLVNLSGQVVGWVTGDYEKELGSNVTVIMAISDYKGILEKMSNGVAAPYLGIRGQEVNAAMAEKGLPHGVYVADCILNGPAYNAGIQPGDVIVQVGEKEIATMKDYQNQLDPLKEGEEITVVVQRKGIDEYKELKYQVIVGAR